MSNIDLNKFQVLNFYHLLDLDFVIPSYQRGYRWEKQQIEELLSDFEEFISNTECNNADGEFYCLQPIVVRRRNNQFEVIDGQQRLTTIYLLMKYLEINDNCDRQSKLTITFDRQTAGSKYLSDSQFIDDINNNGREYTNNIDSFFIFQAYKTISKWFETKEWFETKKRLKIKMAQMITGELGNSPDGEKNDVRVIWYPLNNNDEISSIDAFTRLNEGKIPLTEAELVKALLFQCDCYTENRELMQELAFRRSCEWDAMEKKLQDDNFWAMLVPKDYALTSHIDLVIRFVSKDIQTKQPDKYPFDEDKKLFSYHVIDEFIKDRSSDDKPDKNRSTQIAEAISEIWVKIQDTFNVFYNWYLDRETYHLIGLLTLLNGSDKGQLGVLNELYKTFTEDCKSSKEAISKLRKKIGDILNSESQKAAKNAEFPKTDCPLESISYDNSPKAAIKVLEAFNVYLYLQDITNNSRFQFYKFRHFNVTSLEHIHPQNLDTDNMSFEEVEKWFNDRKAQLPDSIDSDTKDAVEKMNDLILEINKLNNDKDKEERFNERKNDILECEKVIDKKFDELAGMDRKTMHSLRNMALVDKDTNSALSNGFLYQKRTILREREEKEETYVPMGTSAAFDKRFSDKILDMKFWSPDDRNAYFDKIKEAYNYFTKES